MKINEIKKIVRGITGFDYIAVRTGTGSMSGKTLIFCSFNNKCDFKPFESQLRLAFNNIYRVGYDIIELNNYK